MVQTLRFSDLYRNLSTYLKLHECGHDFAGTRKWLETKTDNQAQINTIIMKIQSCGANCDHEITSVVKRNINGRNLLVVIDIL